MPVTPQITLTFTLLDYSGAQLGSAANPAYLRIALCNFGSNLPRVPGTALIAKTASWFVEIPYTGTAGSIPLWGNDVITPAGTYYQISVLDTNRNVIQTNLYVFTGSGTIDLSSAAPLNPLTPPSPPGLPTLQFVKCAGAIPGTSYLAPGQAYAVAYNGLLLQPGQSLPILSYTLVGGTTINLNFTTQAGDLIYALCAVL